MRYEMKLQSFSGVWGHLKQELSKRKKEKKMPRIPHKRNTKLIKEVTQAFLDSKNLSGIDFTIETNEWTDSYVIKFGSSILICVHQENACDTIREGTLTEFLQAQFRALLIVRKLRAREKKRMQHAASEYDDILAAQDLMP